MKIHLDFGHGGHDPGAVGNGLKEKDIVLSVGLKVGQILEKHNVKVFYSRKTDVFVELDKRATLSNNNNVKAFVSIHCNSFSNGQAQGLETFSYSTSKNGAALAKCIQDSILKDKLYTKNRGTKVANFAVLRLTKAPAALVELGFISNTEDVDILKNKQNELAESVAKGILSFVGVKYVSNIQAITGYNILSNTSTTIEQMKEWARGKKAKQKFVDLAPVFYAVSKKSGVNPLVTYAQSGKETGYFKFGGVLNDTFRNPCGMKISGGGGNYDPNAHMRFKTWEDGIQAQVDHLALYAGANGYPKKTTLDPRHFPYLLGTAKTVENLSGKWATDKGYGAELVRMIKEIEGTKVKNDGMIDIKMNVLGETVVVRGKNINDTNMILVGNQYTSIRDMFQALGFKVDWDSKAKTIVVK